MHRIVLAAAWGVLLWMLIPHRAQAQWYLGSQSYALNVDKYDSRYGEAKPVRWSRDVPPPRPPWWTLHRPFRWLKGLAHPDPYHLRAPWDRRHPRRHCRPCEEVPAVGWRVAPPGPRLPGGGPSLGLPARFATRQPKLVPARRPWPAGSALPSGR